MSLLSGLTYDNDIQQEQDVLGGSKFSPVESGVYDATIKYAYLKKSKGGALGLNLGFELDSGKEYTETLYVTSGDSKGNKNFYVNQQGEKRFLPGFVNADAISLFAAQKPLGEMDTEPKVVKIYDFELGKEKPEEVPMITAFIGKQVKLAIKQKLEDKRIKADNGEYVPSGETRTTNEIDKVFHPTNGMTVPEIRAKAESAEFIESWKKKWDGKVQDTSTAKKAEQSGSTGKPASASSLFK